MKKVFSIALSAALALALVGCGGSSSASSAASSSAASVAASSSAVSGSSSSVAAAAPVSGVNLVDVVSAVAAVNPVANARDLDDFSIENDFLLNKDDVVAYSGVMSNDQGNSALILAVQCVSGKADEVKAALETYQQNQIAYYGNYAEFADGLARIQEGRVVEKGDVVLVVFANTDGADYSAIDDAVSAALD